MYNYNILEKKHKEFQYNLELAKSNLKKAEQSEALNFPGFIESNEKVFNYYDKVHIFYIDEIFNINIENEHELLKEAIDWLTEANNVLIKFNMFCSEAKRRGDL